jgi:hypothetical protein
LVLLGSLSGLAACRRDAPPPEDRSAAGTTVGPVEAATDDAKADPTGETGETADPFDPANPGVPIDDANRFVSEDLVRFMADFPQALRKQDETRMRACMANACLPEGVHESVTPYRGAGIRYLVPLWLRGCLTGSAESCLLAGRSYQSSDLSHEDDEPTTHTGWTKDALRERFRRYIARACDLSDVHCEPWADFLLADPNPTPEDVTRAIDRLEAGCDRNEHGSCAALARHADRYPAIGDVGEWWRRACEHDPRVPSADCAKYAEHLLASGKVSDRAAMAALGPVCDPSSPLWKSQCPGDAADASEACDSVYFTVYAFPCVALAEGLPPDDALRLYSALCVVSPVTELNAISREACTEAARLADRLGRSAAYRKALRGRACEVAEMDCFDATAFDLVACGEQRERCVEAP